MTHPPADSPTAAPKWKPLDAHQRRVLGVVIEKAKTTPAAYPMTVNAVVTGCNQKNNREPLMSLEAFDVEKALYELCALGAMSEIDWLGRVPKYKHHGYEWLGVSKLEIAVMTELLLRGEQPLGDLRGRAARLEPIADLAELKPIVDELLARGLMIELTAPGRGQIVSHNLYTPPELAELKARGVGRAPQAGFSAGDAPTSRLSPVPPPTRATEPAPLPQVAAEAIAPGDSADLIADLSAGLAELRAEVARLKERVGNLEA
jgi:uncharacterized protein YceH (UPF0502 family)